MRSSPYAAVLSATERQVLDIGTLGPLLTEMQDPNPRSRPADRTGDDKRVSRTRGQPTTTRENAAVYRAVAADARTEKALRARIAERHPKLHEPEGRSSGVTPLTFDTAGP
ncbi:hypothetical protein [Streptomyces pratensis]|uniref:hypothetical protein n=1 Tax=Streptomyces pratensis TaxID=1169025 RepID=UPI00363D5B26